MAPRFLFLTGRAPSEVHGWERAVDRIAFPWTAAGYARRSSRLRVPLANKRLKTI